MLNHIVTTVGIEKKGGYPLDLQFLQMVAVVHLRQLDSNAAQLALLESCIQTQSGEA